VYGRSSGQAHGEDLEAQRIADVERPDPNAVGMNKRDAASTLFGRCAAVLVDDLVAGLSDIELDGVGRIGRDPRLGQSE